MRRLILAAAAALAVMAAGTLAPNRAEAMTVTTPASIAAAVDANKLIEDVAYTCRRVWRCGYRGCYWTRSCHYTRPYYYGYVPRYYTPRYHYRHHHRRHHW